MEHHSRTRYKSNGNVVDIIRSQGRSVAWLARQISLSRQFTSDTVHGHVEVRPEIAEAIASHLQVPLFLLFEVSESTKSLATEHAA